MVPVGPLLWRCCCAFILFTVAFGLLGWRLYHLQVQRRDDLVRRARRQQRMCAEVPAPRGAIFDARGRPLALSRGRWDLYADPDWMTDKLGATVRLAALLDLPRDTLRRHFESGSNGRCLARDLDEERAAAVRDLGFDGIYLQEVYRRYYPQGNLAPHVLGVVLDDGRGGLGLEQRYQDLLAGTPGRQVLRADARRRPCLPIGSRVVPARPGAHLQLTIDADVQRAVEEALAAAVEKHEPTSASCVVVRPTSGEIVALASWPTFSLLEYRDADPEAFRNQVLAFVYESGSTMKPLVAGAAVAEGVVRWDEEIFCENGRWTCRRGRSARTITDHSYKHGGHQHLTVRQGVAKSDNILMAKVGLRLGPDRLYRWVRRFGFGSLTGICLPGENRGLLLSRDRWNHLGSCISVPIGHEMAVTPLQMAMAHAALANRGVWNPPRLLARVYVHDEDTGRQVDLPLPDLAPRRRIFPVADALEIQEAMREVMRSGTGRRLHLDGYTCAGKTGTTEKLVERNGRKVYSDRNHIGSFVGWAPARPDRNAEILALVIIDDPRKNGHYGSQTAGPVWRRIVQSALETYRVPRAGEIARDELASRRGR